MGLSKTILFFITVNLQSTKSQKTKNALATDVHSKHKFYTQIQGTLVPKLTLQKWAKIERLGFWDPGPCPE